MKNATLLGKQTRKHPEVNLRQAAAEAREADKVRNKNGINKRFTSLKAASEPVSKEHDEDGGVTGVMHPTDEQLEVINQFTRSPKTAEELVVFNTLSANDLVDRDFDQFPQKTIQEFAELEQPFSSVGKSYMVGHDYNKLPVGRIFDVGTDTVDGAHFLTNGVYIPNTKSNEPFIENVDFGVNWAVSVGVMMGANECSICASPMSSFFGFCYENGHMKGYSYDPNSDKTDDWGYALPAEDGDPNAKLAVGLMKEPRDFYELSQVFLGAQYFAALDEKSAIGGIVKAAGAAGVPIIGLSKKEAEDLPLPKQPKQVADALSKYSTETDDDGSIYWTDENQLRWVFDPEESEVLCLGRSSDQEEDDGTTDAGIESGTERGEDGSGSGDDGQDVGDVDGTGTSRSGDDGSADEQDGTDDGEASSGSERSVGSGSEAGDAAAESDAVADQNSTNDNSEEDDVDVDKLVRDAFAAAKVPEGVLADVTSKGEGLLKDVVSKLVAENASLKSKAELGASYVKQLRADAIAMYVKAHQQNGEAVKTERFEKMLDAFGDDVDLIKDALAEQQAIAQERFPKSVRRSTFQEDPNARQRAGELPEEEWDQSNDDRVSKLHG